MPQQVLAYLAAHGGAYSAGELAARLAMPISTVRAHLRRLDRGGRVRRLEGRYGGRILWEATMGTGARSGASGRPDGPPAGGSR